MIYFSPNLSKKANTALSLSMGVPKTSELRLYLGCQVLHQGRNYNDHVLLLQRVGDKPSGWKKKCLYRAGQLTLAKPIINNMTVFHMQTKRLPANVHKGLNRAVHQCVWGSSTDQRRLHLLSWDVLCRPKERGGAGLRKSEPMN